MGKEGLYTGGPNPHALPVWLVFTIFFTIASPPTILFILFARRIAARPAKHRTAIVLVLGDIGRSPRMMYHAASLAKSDWETFVVGYGDTVPIPALLETPLVHLLHLQDPPKPLLLLPWVLRAPIRVAYQVFSVIYLCIFVVPYNTEILLVQNPPSIPTLLLAQIISFTARTRLIIDWHNTGYSILAMRLGTTSPFVRIAKWFEETFGQNAYAHLFVTRALEEFLVGQWHLRGRTAVLHDRPPANFRRTDPLTQHQLFSQLARTLVPPLPSSLAPTEAETTAFTQISAPGDLPTLRPDRPALIVSSTSWTADEDFSVLLTALDAYQTAKSSTHQSQLPALVVIITGLGALRAPFESAVAKREKAGTWSDIHVRCAFVSAHDYPTLLGSADLGVSLHSSSSGRDLPMKVVDMFGCGVPVLARDFACIAELVKEGKNGHVFTTPQQLGTLLIDVLSSFPDSAVLGKLRSYFDKAPGDEWSSWDENWDAIMKRGVLNFHRQ